MPGERFEVSGSCAVWRELARLWNDEQGLTTVEYALLLALVAVAAIGAWTTLGDRMSATVSLASSQIGQNPNP